MHASEGMRKLLHNPCLREFLFCTENHFSGYQPPTRRLITECISTRSAGFHDPEFVRVYQQAAKTSLSKSRFWHCRLFTAHALKTKRDTNVSGWSTAKAGSEGGQVPKVSESFHLRQRYPITEDSGEQIILLNQTCLRVVSLVFIRVYCIYLSPLWPTWATIAMKGVSNDMPWRK